jgi:hypothetical protein
MTWRPARVDLLVVVVLAIAMTALSLYSSSLIAPIVYQQEAATLHPGDAWFDGDLPGIVCMALDRRAEEHVATDRHPLLPVAWYAPVAFMTSVEAISTAGAIRVTIALQAAGWLATLFLVLRLMGLATLDAAVFAMLAAVTSASLFWTAVPESFLPGAITMLVPAIAIAVQRHRHGDRWLAAASAISASVTITNWISGAIAALLTRRPARALQITLIAGLLVAALWAIQSFWFPATLFPGSGQLHELASDRPRPAPGRALVVSLLHSVVMPVPLVVAQRDATDSSMLSVQASSVRGGSALYAGSLLLWATLFVAGLTQTVRSARSGVLERWLLAMVLAQLALHSRVGLETFLYSMHVAPLLVLVAAGAALGRWRRVALGLAMAGIVALGINNHRVFTSAAGFTHALQEKAVSAGATLGPPYPCGS